MPVGLQGPWGQGEDSHCGPRRPAPQSAGACDVKWCFCLPCPLPASFKRKVMFFSVQLKMLLGLEQM